MTSSSRDALALRTAGGEAFQLLFCSLLPAEIGQQAVQHSDGVVVVVVVWSELQTGRSGTQDRSLMLWKWPEIPIHLTTIVFFAVKFYVAFDIVAVLQWLTKASQSNRCSMIFFFFFWRLLHAWLWNAKKMLTNQMKLKRKKTWNIFDSYCQKRNEKAFDWYFYQSSGLLEQFWKNMIKRFLRNTTCFHKTAKKIWQFTAEW